MKRPNPKTGLPFVRGDIRDDGYQFSQYVNTRFDKYGFCQEYWLHPEIFKKDLVKRSARRKKSETKSRHIGRARNAKRRAAKLQRTPKWLKDYFTQEISLFYRRASLIKQFIGEDWHVDHIVPLQGKSVSGLHVPWNLQLLPAIENIKKGNKHVDKG